MSIKKTFHIPDKDNTTNPNKEGYEIPNKYITDEQAFIKYFNVCTKTQTPYSKKYFCVMLFERQSDITGNYFNRDEYNTWINTLNAYFHNGMMALDYYANTPCPASQLIDAESIQELITKRNQMLDNFKDKQFLDDLEETL